MLKRAFSLIELLVVVLIIGVLAAIAYPQYQVVVWKARIAKLLPLGRHLAQQSQLFYEESGRYPTTPEMVVFIPDSFKMKEEYHEEIDSHPVWWDNGSASVYCADGEEDPASCRLVGMSLRGNDWADPLSLIFNARVDNVSSDLYAYPMACVAGSYIPGKEYNLTHKICRSLGGKLLTDSSMMYVID